MASRMPKVPCFPSFSRRVIAELPDGSSCQIALPSDDAEFQFPAPFPAATTRPSGSPSGVKNPAFTADSPFFEIAAAAASAYLLPGPSGWSTTASRWLRESKDTPSKSMPAMLADFARAGSMGERSIGAAGGGGVTETDGLSAVATGDGISLTGAQLETKTRIPNAASKRMSWICMSAGAWQGAASFLAGSRPIPISLPRCLEFSVFSCGSLWPL